MSKEYPEKKDLATFVEYVCSFAGTDQIPPAMSEYALDLRDMLQAQEEDFDSTCENCGKPAHYDTEVILCADCEKKVEPKRDGAADIRQAYKFKA